MACYDCDPAKKVDDEMRKLIFHRLVERGRANKEFGDSLQTLNFFRVMDVVDEIFEAFKAAAAEQEIQSVLQSSANGS